MSYLSLFVLQSRESPLDQVLLKTSSLTPKISFELLGWLNWTGNFNYDFFSFIRIFCDFDLKRVLKTLLRHSLLKHVYIFKNSGNT